MKKLANKLLLTLLAPLFFLCVCLFEGIQRGFKRRVVQFWEGLKSIWLE